MSSARPVGVLGYRDPVHRRTCPLCQQLLVVTCCSPGTELELDRCEAHGVFFERREFQAYETAIVVKSALLEDNDDDDAQVG